MSLRKHVNSGHPRVNFISKLIGKLILISICLPVLAAKEEFYTYTGYELNTVINGSVIEDATLSFDIVFSDDQWLDLVYLFEGDPSTTVISSSFNGAPLDIIIGDDPIAGDLIHLIIDVEAYNDQSGVFELSLSSTGSEVATLFLITDMRADVDEDGLADEDETDTGIYISDSDTGTDPDNMDTDGDGMGDGFELFYGLSPHDSSDGSTDLDGDGVTNLDEFLGGSRPGPATSLAGEGNSSGTSEGSAEVARFSDGVLSIPTVEVAGDYYRLDLVISNENPIEFGVGDVELLSAPVAVEITTFSNNILSIPRLLFGTTVYRLDLELIATAPYTFGVYDYEELQSE